MGSVEGAEFGEIWLIDSLMVRLYIILMDPNRNSGTQQTIYIFAVIIVLVLLFFVIGLFTMTR